MTIPLNPATRAALCNSGRIVDCGDGFLVRERTPEESAAVDAAILVEFNGMNHSQLAHDYHVSLQWVYHLVKHSRLQSVSLALRQVAGIEPEVVWASPLAGAEPLFVLEAGLQAFETAKARILAEGQSQGPCQVMHRLLVAVAVLPPAHPAVLAANGRAAAQAARAETPPNTPAPAGNPPASPSAPQAGH